MDDMELDDLIASPDSASVGAVKQLNGDLLVLGAGGMIGPPLALLAQRSAMACGWRHRVLCASRFTDALLALRLARHGARAVACDLFERKDLERLPDAPNVVYLVGTPSGSSPGGAWAGRTLLPAAVAERFQKSRIVALSTTDLYPWITPDLPGADESVPPAAVGERAQAFLAQERIFEHAAQRWGARVLNVRLSEACDLRRGPLMGLASDVAAGRAPSDGAHLIAPVWMRDVCSVVLRAFALCTGESAVLNVSAPTPVAADECAAAMALAAGIAAPPAARSPAPAAQPRADSRACWDRFGPPALDVQTLAGWAIMREMRQRAGG